MSDHFLHVAQMLDDLRADDKELRNAAMRGLVTIAQTLGPERTREELIPYVTDYLDDDDGILRTMATKLGGMLNEVGGIAHVDVLLQPLETLCTLDEITVRDEATQAITNLVKAAFSPAGGSVEAQNKVVAVINRLASSEFAPSRCSACGLVAAPYPLAPVATKRELKTIFGKLCEDPEVMVRRAACVALAGPVTVAMDEAVAEFTSQLAKFCKDASDTVRLQSINAAIAMCPFLTDGGVTQVIGLMKALGNDTAWRVRFMLADRVSALCHVWPQRDAGRVGLSLFKILCNDPAPEIKAAAVFNLDQLLQCLPEENKTEALDVAVRLVDDPTPHVRSCLASVLLKAVPLLPRPTWASTVIPATTKLLQDADPHVRLGIIGSFTAANMGKDDGLRTVANAITPVIIQLAADANWRVRETVVQQLPAVVQAGADFSTPMLDVAIGSLTDRVATIRAAGANACKQLAARHGGAWVTSTLMPRVASLAQSKNYMQRVTLMYVVRLLVEVVDESTCKSELNPIMIRMAADPVPNVRMNAALAMRAALTHRKLAPGDVETMSSKLRQDVDADVRDAMSPPVKA